MSTGVGCLVLVGLLVVLGAVSYLFEGNKDTPHQVNQPGPSAEVATPQPGVTDSTPRAPNTVPADNPSPDVSPGITDKAISVDATSLLAAYQADEKAANARYENRKVAVTGVLSGVFIPSTRLSMRMAETGSTATAFITMAGPVPSTVEETLFIPGIKAYSGSSSLFGQRNTLVTADRMRIGETVTLVCTVKDAFRVSDLVVGPYNENADYSVTLEDCTLQNNPQSGEPSQGPTQNLSRPETAVPGDQTAPNNVPSIHKAAEQGDADAQSKLGMMYHNGQGMPQDYAQAVYWTRMAAEQGFPIAENNLGSSYAVGQGVTQDYAQAATWFRKAAEQGNAPAQNNLGLLYWRGQGVTQDYAQAATWFRKAAEQGITHAQSYLGSLYAVGQGVTQDYAQAAAWFRKAAEQGDAPAQKYLANLYYLGLGVPQDYAQAYFWIAIAASGKIEGVRQEDFDASRDDAASHLTPAEVSQVEQRVRKWLEEHPTKVE